MKFIVAILLGIATAPVMGQLYINSTYTGVLGHAIIVADSGYIVSGWHSDTTLRILKINSSGDSVWAKDYAMPYIASATRIIKTSDSNYAMCGYMWNQSSDTAFTFIIKFNALGDTLWTSKFRVRDFDTFQDIKQTPDRGYIAVGYSYAFGSNNYRYYAVKTDSSGSLEWEKTGTELIWASSVEITKDGNYLLGGWSGTMFTHIDPAIIKLDNLGGKVWSRSIPSPHYGGGASGAKELDDGGYLLYGTMAVADPYNGDIYIAKLDSGRQVLWQKTYGPNDAGTGVDGLHDLKVLGDGSFIACGEGSLLPQSNMVKGELIKFCPNGDLQWIRYYGVDNFPSHFYDLDTTTGDGGFVFVGSTRGTSGSQEMWVVKTDSIGCDSIGCAAVPPPCPEDTTVTVNEEFNSLLNIYPNPFEESFTIKVSGRRFSISNIRVFNPLGQTQEIRPYVQSNGSIIIDGSGWQSGIYFIQILYTTKSGRLYTARLVKK